MLKYMILGATALGFCSVISAQENSQNDAIGTSVLEILDQPVIPGMCNGDETRPVCDAQDSFNEAEAQRALGQQPGCVVIQPGEPVTCTELMEQIAALVAESEELEEYAGRSTVATALNISDQRQRMSRLRGEIYELQGSIGELASDALPFWLTRINRSNDNVSSVIRRFADVPAGVAGLRFAPVEGVSTEYENGDRDEGDIDGTWYAVPVSDGITLYVALAEDNEPDWDALRGLAAAVETQIGENRSLDYILSRLSEYTENYEAALARREELIAEIAALEARIADIDAEIQIRLRYIDVSEEERDLRLVEIDAELRELNLQLGLCRLAEIEAEMLERMAERAEEDCEEGGDDGFDPSRAG